MAGPPTARVPVVIDASRLTPQVVALREFGLAIAAACDRYLEVFVDAPAVPDAAVLSVVPDVAPTSSGTTDTLWGRPGVCETCEGATTVPAPEGTVLPDGEGPDGEPLIWCPSCDGAGRFGPEPDLDVDDLEVDVP